jgi:hypothetical protein
MTHKQILDAFREKFLLRGSTGEFRYFRISDGPLTERAQAELIPKIESFILTALQAERKAALQEAREAVMKMNDLQTVGGFMVARSTVLSAIDYLISKEV